MIVKTTDFTGFYAISQNKFDKDALQAYIDQYEKDYLQDLLGCELYDIFIADLDVNGVPQTVIYQTIYNELCVDESLYTCTCDKVKRSSGIKQMLKGFIYYHYIRDQRLKNTISGTIVNDNENSVQASTNELITLIHRRYNDSINSYKAIQSYIDYNFSTYPDYKGSCKDYIYW